MKFLILAIIFFSSITALSQSNPYPDGSYYNDDIITINDPIIPTYDSNFGDKNSMMPAIEAGGAAPSAPKSTLPVVKRRSPAGGFVPVRTGGRVGDFEEVSADDDESPKRKRPKHIRGTR